MSFSKIWNGNKAVGPGNPPIDNPYLTGHTNQNAQAMHDAKASIIQQAMMQQAMLHQTALANQYTYNNTYPNGAGSGGSGQGVIGQGALGQMGTLGNGSATNKVPFNASSPYTAADAYAASAGLPPISGILTTVAFVAADGNCHYMVVDTAYADNLKKVSIIHSFLPNGANPAPAKAPAMASDFSEDEIELAKAIINEQAEIHA